MWASARCLVLLCVVAPVGGVLKPAARHEAAKPDRAKAAPRHAAARPARARAKAKAKDSYRYYNRSVPGQSFMVHHQKTGSLVRLPWLKFFWAATRKDVLDFRAAYKEHISGHPSDPVVPDGERIFGSEHASFTEALTHHLPPNLQEKLLHCALGQPTKGNGDSRGHIWIFVNGQSLSGEEFWLQMRDILDPTDRAVILGNWWNATHETYHGLEVSSLWVPYASTSFAERKTRTPMDLVHRSVKTRFYYTDWKRSLLAYQGRTCNAPAQMFWDQLNSHLKETMDQRGSAISTCNGKKDSGERVELEEGRGFKHGQLDSSVSRYEHFKYVFVPEAHQNPVGHISERIVDAFLAGAVPIYSGAAQIGEVFNPDRFIQVDVANGPERSASVSRLSEVMNSTTEYDKLLDRGKTPVVTEEAMRKFFTWHPDTWSKYGDDVKQHILAEVGRLCGKYSEL